MTPCGLLLAAGRSRRFGAADKLLAPLDGRPLVRHAADALVAAGFAPRIAVTESDAVADLLPDFTCVPPGPGAPAQAASLVAGVAAAQAAGAQAVLVTLGDMPQVTPDLLRAVAGCATPGQAAAATDGTRPMPPACFPAALFPDLLALTGDRGAATLLRALPASALVAAPPGTLADIDIPADLGALTVTPS